MTIQVAVIEDQRDIRDSLRLLIDGTPGFRASGVYRTMEEALEKLEHALPQVALVDIGLPGMSGIEGIAVMKWRFPSVIAIVLSIFDDDRRIFEALCAGAVGYLLKKTPPTRLLDSIKAAVEGDAPMTPEVARRVISLFQSVRPPAKAPCVLTTQEMRLLRLLVEGESYKTAAAILGVGMSTISFHTRNIYQKLHVHSKSEAVAKALRHGMVL